MGTTTDWTPEPAETSPAEPETPAGKLWAQIVWLASWILPPILMAGAYTILALTSDTDTTGKAWMAIGFCFVLVLWLVFRIAVESAGLARALSMGDTDRIHAIVGKQLRHRRNDAARAPYLIYKAVAHELKGEHADALAAASSAKPEPERVGQALLALSVRIHSLVELGRTSEAQPLLDELDTLAKRVDRRLDPMPLHYAHVARARLLAADAKTSDASAELSKVIDDIRAGEAVREHARALRSSLA
ncbi:MAG TPA: hypothetical protein VL326_31355 [Kofleriaceae bacterium]|jgi:hypothetical protein|nr:hypothetical protein [Kofleriaceae bacterium]